MPGEARSPLTPDPATSTPLAGDPAASSPDHQPDEPDRHDEHDETDRDDAADPLDSTGPTVGGVPATARERPSRQRRRRLFLLLGMVAVLAYVTDQLSKVAAVDTLADGEPRRFLGDFIQFRLIGNPGAALSLGAGNTWVMTAIALGVLVAIVFVAKGLGSWAWALALGLLLGAALGNLTDRFARPPGGGQGHVVDFLDYNRWFIGNVADIWIVSAAVLIVILAVLGIGVDGRRDRDRDRQPREGERAQQRGDLDA